MKMPVAGRNPAFLPIGPSRVLFDGRPDFLRRERKTGSKAARAARDVHADQNASDIEDNGTDPVRRHGLFALGTGDSGRALGPADIELMPRTKNADDRWQNREEDDNGNDVMDALADVRNRAAQGVAAEDHGGDPENSARNVESQVAGIGHLRSAGDRRTKRSNDGNEARENHGSAAVFLVEIMGALKMTAAEEKRVFAAVESSSSRAADPVTNLIPDNGAKHNGKEEPFEWNDPGSGENASGNKQGITGKKKSHKETGFYEYDGADERGPARAD